MLPIKKRPQTTNDPIVVAHMLFLYVKVTKVILAIVVALYF